MDNKKFTTVPQTDNEILVERFVNDLQKRIDKKLEGWKHRMFNEEEAKMSACDHGLAFDPIICRDQNLSSRDVQKMFPRLSGECPLKCGYVGIAYVSMEHFLYGDW